jgi:hypothetical protein
MQKSGLYSKYCVETRVVYNFCWFLVLVHDQIFFMLVERGSCAWFLNRLFTLTIVEANSIFAEFFTCLTWIKDF